jgi:release factor glutamine methyltransferase
LSGQELMGGVDVILSNPPYISEAEWSELQPEVRLFEPRLALVGGPTGIEFHERLLGESPEFLIPGGWLLMEVGQGQAAVVREMVGAVEGYGSAEVIEDAAGIERVVIVRRTE